MGTLSQELANWLIKNNPQPKEEALIGPEKKRRIVKPRDVTKMKL